MSQDKGSKRLSILSNPFGRKKKSPITARNHSNDSQRSSMVFVDYPDVMSSSFEAIELSELLPHNVITDYYGEGSINLSSTLSLTQTTLTQPTSYGATEPCEEVNIQIQILEQKSEGKCSVFDTTCNLISLMTGTGLLALPYAAMTMGFSANLLLVFLAIVYFYTLSLVASSIDFLHQRNTYNLLKPNDNIPILTIDYLSLGSAAFGPLGGRIVGFSLAAELLLALVSFFINIGLNISTLNNNIHPFVGIIFASLLSMILSSFHIKFVSYSSALGVAMTFLIVITLLISSLQVERESINSSYDVKDKKFDQLNLSGVPLSLGLIAFCFGGHGAS